MKTILIVTIAIYKPVFVKSRKMSAKGLNPPPSTHICVFVTIFSTESVCYILILIHIYKYVIRPFQENENLLHPTNKLHTIHPIITKNLGVSACVTTNMRDVFHTNEFLLSLANYKVGSCNFCLVHV